MKKRITNELFTIRFVTIMCFDLRLKTIGQAKKFLDTCNPNMKLRDVRASRLKKELDAYFKDLNTNPK